MQKTENREKKVDYFKLRNESEDINIREDRIQPCKSTTSIKRDPNSIKKNSSDEAEWECEHCKKINKISVYKCESNLKMKKFVIK